MKKILIAFLTITTFMFILTGCGVSKEESEKVKTASEPILENILSSISNKDINSFSKDFDDNMKNAFKEDSFKQLYEMINTKIGTYKSKELQKVQKTKGNYVLIYKAKYDKEPKDVIITLSLTEKDGNYRVSGLYLNSPELRSK